MARLHALIALAAFHAFGGAPHVFAQDINIGLAVPRTGPFAPLGQEVRHGVETAIGQINRAGGVLQRPLTLKEVDDNCDPRAATGAAQKLIAQKVVAVIGHLCTPAFMAAAAAYAKAGVLMLNTTSMDHTLTDVAQQRGWRHVFRVMARRDQQGLVAGLYLGRQFSNAKIALVRDKTPMGDALANGLRAVLADRKLTPAPELHVTDKASSIGPVIWQLLVAAPAAVYLATSPLNVARIVKQAKERGLTATFLSSEAISQGEFSAIAGTAAEGVLSTSALDPRRLESAGEALALLRERGFEVGQGTLYAYTALQVVAQAINLAGSADPAPIQQVLRNHEFETAIGHVRFDRKGDLAVAAFEFSQWREGRYVGFDASPHWDFVKDGERLQRTYLATQRSTSVDPKRNLPFEMDSIPSSGVLPLSGRGHRRTGSRSGTKLGNRPPERPPQAAKSDDRRFDARAVQGVFWNTFFTHGTNKDARLDARSNASYTLVLDLSAYSYRQITATNASGTEVAPAVRRHLAIAPKEPVELKIRPVAITRQLSIDDVPVKPMKIDRQKLVRSQSVAGAASEKNLIADFQSGRSKVVDFSRSVAAGQVTFQVSVNNNTRAGCAVIAFTIWDFHDNPIDHLLQTIPIDDGPTKADCRAVQTAEALKGGFGTLLDPAFSVGPGSDKERPIQAALHLFETREQGAKKTFAIFIDKTQYSAPQPGHPETERGVYAWRLGHWLSDYISAAHGLPAQIDFAWKEANKGRANAYAQVGNELAIKIFGAEPGDEAKADSAKTALIALASAHPAPVVLARLIGSENQKLYIPLGLLAGSGNMSGLPKPITVLQPLPEERYGTRQCIRTWSFALSKETKDLSDERTKGELAKLKQDQPLDGEAWVETNAALRRHVSTRVETDQPSEGFVLLAHHDAEGIFIELTPAARVAGGISPQLHARQHGAAVILRNRQPERRSENPKSAQQQRDGRDDRVAVQSAPRLRGAPGGGICQRGTRAPSQSHHSDAGAGVQ